MRRCSPASIEASSAVSHCSVRVSSSSRGGSTPPATSTCRSWSAASAPGPGIERLVGGGQGARGDLGEDRGAAAAAQPVERGLGRAGCADRLEHGYQRGRDVPARAGEQRRGPAPQAAPLAPAALIELVFDAAVGACAGDGLPGAAGAGVRVRAGRGYRAAQLPAGCARHPAPQRGGVARVADRPFGPAGLRRAVLAAAGAAGGGPRRARRADRMVAGGEVAFAVLAAHAADGAGHLVAVDADVRRAVAAAHRDRGGLAADPARAVAPVAAAAPLADSAARRRRGRRLRLTSPQCAHRAVSWRAVHGLHMPPPGVR